MLLRSFVVAAAAGMLIAGAGRTAELQPGAGTSLRTAAADVPVTDWDRGNTWRRWTYRPRAYGNDRFMRMPPYWRRPGWRFDRRYGAPYRGWRPWWPRRPAWRYRNYGVPGDSIAASWR